MSVLYLSGLVFTLVYLLYVGAVAAWIPLALETLVAVGLLALKVLYDRTTLLGAPRITHPLSAAAAAAAAAQAAQALEGGGGGGGRAAGDAHAQLAEVPDGGAKRR